MIKYYAIGSGLDGGLTELTESEWLALTGDDTIRPYAGRVYREEITIEDVPEDIREAVQAVVDTKVARWGLYSERNISDTEALSILIGGDD